MRWTSDLATGALYFEVSDAPIASQRELADGLIADLDDSEAIVGLEVLDEGGRGALLVLAAQMKELSEADGELIFAVVTSQVSGDRERLGMQGRPPVESEDVNRTSELAGA